MPRHLMPVLLALAMPLLLGGCVAAVVGGAAVGARAAHDRRDLGTWFDDKRIVLDAYDSLNRDKELALHNNVSLVVYNGVLLIVGQVRTEELRHRAEQRVSDASARRIVNELAGKLGAPGLAIAAGSATPRGGAAADALSALANLGFKPAEASAAVAAANEELGPDAGLDALVRLALKKAAR